MSFMSSSVSRLQMHRMTPIAQLVTLAVAAVPKLGCPLCWPMFTLLCGALGIQPGKLDHLLMLFALAYASAALWHLLRRRSIGALLIFVAAVTILLFRLGSAPVWLAYAGGAALAVSFAWRAFLSFFVAHGQRYTQSCCSASVITAHTNSR